MGAGKVWSRFEAMRKRGLTVHALTSEIEKEWRSEAAKLYPKIGG